MPVDPCVSSPGRWSESQHYLRGVELFNQRLFWESHEAWEQIWLECEGVQAEFLQGLIQSAAALLKYQRGEFAPAQRLHEAALNRLRLCPESYMGLDVREFQRRMRECFAPLLAGRIETLNLAAAPRIELELPSER